jgi:hypothetical protein
MQQSLVRDTVSVRILADLETPDEFVNTVRAVYFGSLAGVKK